MVLYPEHKPFDGNPSGGRPTRPKPKPEESQPDWHWYYSHIFPPPTSEESSHVDEDAPAEQSNGQASSSDSGKQSSAGFSQAEDSNEADREKDVISLQALLPDIADMQDVFGASEVFDGIDPDRWYHRYSNPDVIPFQQDIETRPLIFQHCFQHSASLQDALEFIYAFPAYCNEDELRDLEQIAVGMPETYAGMAGGDAGNAPDSGFMNTGSGGHDFLIEYEEYLETRYGYQIEWGSGTYNTNKLKQLHNLGRASALIIDYLTDEVYDGDESVALFAFRQFYSLSEFGRLAVNLGADEKLKESTYGYVPPAYYNKERKLTNENLEELNQVYLGSAVDIATIVHEFGHVIDRSVKIVWQFDHNRDFRDQWLDETKVNMDLTIYHESIEGLAAKQRATQEVWADTFMTAVLDLSTRKFGREYDVYSVKADYVDDLPFFRLYSCTDVTCKRRPVRWRRDDEGNLDDFARSVMDYMPDLLREVMNPAKWRWIDELDLQNL